MTGRIQPTLAIAAHDMVGEASAWDAGLGRMPWTENTDGVVREARSRADGGWSETRRGALGRPIAAMTPRTKETVRREPVWAVPETQAVASKIRRHGDQAS